VTESGDAEWRNVALGACALPNAAKPPATSGVFRVISKCGLAQDFGLPGWLCSSP
jgi:hypothetical protein